MSNINSVGGQRLGAFTRAPWSRTCVFRNETILKTVLKASQPFLIQVPCNICRFQLVTFEDDRNWIWMPIYPYTFATFNPLVPTWQPSFPWHPSSPIALLTPNTQPVNAITPNVDCSHRRTDNQKPGPWSSSFSVVFCSSDWRPYFLKLENWRFKS